MKKTVITIIIVLAILIAISGAIIGGVIFVNLTKAKPSITAEDFKNSMEQKGYMITDANDQILGYDYINQVYLALSNDYTFQIEFYELADENYAMNVYNNNKSVIESSKGSASTETNVNWKNYSKYTLSSNGYYMVVSRINNTVIFVNVEDNYKDNVKTVLNELGY